MASAVITWSGIGQASAYDWRNTPSELFDFNSQSQGRCWYVRTALETLCTQIGGEWSASRAKENYRTLLESEFDSGSTSHLSVYLTPRDLTAWSQQLYRDDKCTKQLYSVWILPVNYKRIMNRHARRIDPSTHVLTLAGETRLAPGGLRHRRSVLLNTFLTLRILFTIYPYAFSSARITVVVFQLKKKERFSMRSVLTFILTHTGNQNRLYNLVDYVHIDKYYWKPELITWR